MKGREKALLQAAKSTAPVPRQLMRRPAGEGREGILFHILINSQKYWSVYYHRCASHISGCESGCELSRLSRSTARPLERDRPGWVGDQGTKNEMESTILGQKRLPKVRKMRPEIVPGGSGSPLGPPWEIFRNNGWLKYGFGEDFDRQKGGQEGPKGRPGEAQEPPQSAFLDAFFDIYSENAFLSLFLSIFC